MRCIIRSLILLIAFQSDLAAQEIPSQAKAAAIKRFLAPWKGKNAVWFLAVGAPPDDGELAERFVEPSPEFLAIVQSEIPNVFPLSEAQPDSTGIPTEIFRKGTNSKGAYLRVHMGKWVKNNQIRITIECYWGGHAGGGSSYRLRSSNGRWVVVKNEGGFDI